MKKSDTKEYIMYNSNYIEFQKIGNTRDVRNINLEGKTINKLRKQRS